MLSIANPLEPAVLSQRLLSCCFAAAVSSVATFAGAQVASGAGAPLLDEAAVRAFVSQQVAGSGTEMTRFDVRLGQLDLAALAPCRRTETFLPASGRLWGRGSIGVRCTEGATWTVMLPVTVSVWGQAVVAAAPLAAGTVLGPQDVRLQEIELTREPASLLRDAQLVAGRTLTRMVNPGQALRADMVRVTSVVQTGDPVRLRLLGTGYAVVASGQALHAAGEGQPVRVRTELGKILTGVAREGRQVDVAL